MARRKLRLVDMRSEMLLDVLIVIIVVALRLLSVGFTLNLPEPSNVIASTCPAKADISSARSSIHADTVDPGDTTKDEEDKPQDGSRPPQG